MLGQKYEDACRKNSKVEHRYKELKTSVQTYEMQYRNKTQELLHEIEYLKELVSRSIQNSLSPA